MRGLQKSKRVSWAPDLNLCQVKLFLSDDSPSHVGLSGQDHLQAKTSWHPQPFGTGSDDNLPPGFEGPCPASLLKNKLSQIPVIKWRCPPRFTLDVKWQVVSGEESKETVAENQREMRVLEAIYPRPSAIPPNPSLLMGIDESPFNDQNTPLIPMTPIEDEEAMADASVDTMASNSVPMGLGGSSLAPGTFPAPHNDSTHHPNPTTNGNASSGMIPGVEPDIAAAAYAALTAVMPSGDQGGPIDRDLLIKILSDPKLLEKLLADHRGATNPQIMPKPRPHGINLSEPPPVHINRVEAAAPPLVVPTSGPFYRTPPNRVVPLPSLRPPPESLLAPSPSVGAPVPKDINYYKSLIQQHGGETQDNLPQFGSRQNHQLGASLEPASNPKLRDSKPKIMKPCIYFNSSRGCRHGVNCAYQHDTSSQQQQPSSMPEVQGAKRMKLDREITGS